MSFLCWPLALPREDRLSVLEGPHRLLDWGVREATESKNAKCVEIVLELIAQYRPHVLVLENTAAKDSCRRARVQELLDAIRQAARSKGVKVAERWTSVAIKDRRILKLTDAELVLTYSARAQREGEPSKYSALVASGYVNRDGSWKLAFHQQTPTH